MEFDPGNPIVQRCLQGMAKEDQHKPEEAAVIFLQAWNEATSDFEQYLAAHYVARHQHTAADRLNGLKRPCSLLKKSIMMRLSALTLRCTPILPDATRN